MTNFHTVIHHAEKYERLRDELQRKRIAELEEALLNVLAWEAPIELAAPELGGCLKAMWAARAVLQKHKTED